MPGANRTQKQGKKSKPAKTKRAGVKVGKKQRRAEDKSEATFEHVKKQLSEGKPLGAFYLGSVTHIDGGGRFHVKDMDGQGHYARLSKLLSTKGAKHADAQHVTAVRVGSHVIVDGTTIRSVIGDAAARELRHLMGRVSAKSNNTLFERAHSSKSASSKKSKGSTRSKKGKSNSNVNLNLLGGFFGF